MVTLCTDLGVSIVAEMIEKEQAKTVVEVGVFAGGLSRLIAALPCVERLCIVDPWKIPYHSTGKEFTQQDMDEVAASVIDWSHSEPKVSISRMTSEEAAPLFENESIDFFHTDGDHATEMVRKDIALWLPKVKEGCLLTGDNYEMPSVAKAVDELLPAREIHGKGRIWAWRKR